MVETVAAPATAEARVEELGGLAAGLHRLDLLLQRGVAAAQASHGVAAADPFRGLYVGGDEVERLLAREAGAVTLAAPAPPAGGLPDAAPPGSRLAWLAQRFGLTPFDVDLVLLALAPEVDRRYQRLYAYLQDDVTQRYPTVDLALNLFCASPADKLARRAHFAPHAPLLRHALLHLVPEPVQPRPPLLAHALQLDDQIVDVLLEQAGLDRRLLSFAELLAPGAAPSEPPLGTDRWVRLLALARDAWAAPRSLRLYFQGPPGAGQEEAAAALAAALGTPLLRADLARALATATDFAEAVRVLFREAWLHGAVLQVTGLDTLRALDHLTPWETVLAALSQADGVVILNGSRPWSSSGSPVVGVVPVAFSMPAAVERLACWRACLARQQLVAEADAVEALAGRFRLTPGQIAEAASTARAYAHLAEPPPPNGDGLADGAPRLRQALFAAARAQCGHDLAALARKVYRLATWDDLVLPDEPLAQLREIVARVVQRERVLAAWGFDRKLSRGKGVNALFAGPSGTGKTMAAEVLAGELGLDLYQIDLSGMVSKYIGETEKNLDRVFGAAHNTNAVLFFDEADALFGKRSEVRDSHDRYANLEVSYLLQKMEEYEGVAILATNLRQNLDEAFLRRLAFTVHFPFPEDAQRERIWRGVWPAATPLAPDVDLDRLARQFRFSGGNIKNASLAAAFLAAADGGVVTQAHLLHAVRREYQKLGMQLSEADLDGTPLGAAR